ncbi:MAG: hypothetical protein HQL50_02695 [Magnetococcales bacterium]|nr:hypothetical protein [Magnetococcales bacterium]
MESEQEGPIPRTLFITGANDPYFTVITSLLMSFRLFEPNQTLMVCDFGLSNEQCRFLSSQGILLPMPTDLKGGLHPFYYKASIWKYVEHIDFDRLVWIDGDCLIANPVAREINKHFSPHIAKGAPFMGACQDSVGTIGQFCNNFDVAPFDKLLDQHGISRDLPYLNSAVFMVNSHEMLREWHRLIFEIESHILHEQNLFNILTYTLFDSPELLDRRIWNVHDLHLNDLKVETDTDDPALPYQILLNDAPVQLAHATSFQGRAVTAKPMRIPVGDRVIDGYVRTTKNPHVAYLFQSMMSYFLLQNKADLTKCGVLN